MPGDDSPGRDHVVVISYALWQRRYASSPGVTGVSITVDDAAYTIVGVLRPDFNLFGTTRCQGFDKVVWKAKPIENGVELTHLSADGDQGLPREPGAHGPLHTAGSALRIESSATTDKPTVVNLTNHSYFNLAGQGNGGILKQVMQINASHYTPADSTLIPTGEIPPVKGTPFDFRTPHVNRRAD